MEILIRDARFWVALLLLIRSVLFYVVPAFPEQIWVAIDTFVGVVLGILAGNNVVQTRRQRAHAISSRHGGNRAGRHTPALARATRSGGGTVRSVGSKRAGPTGSLAFLLGTSGFTQASPSFAEVTHDDVGGCAGRVPVDRGCHGDRG